MNTSITKRILSGESQILEFKFEINDARKIAETISAFSNSDGGSILIGVKDNGSIAGVRSTEEYYMIQSACELYCKPEVAFESKQWQIDKKEILEIIIPASNKKPVMAVDINNKLIAYFRKDAANYKADPVLVTIWKDELTPTKPATYSKNEDMILHLFNNETLMTLSKIANKTKIEYRTCIKIVAQLIKWEILEYTIVQGKLIYYLK